jgi:hypothetical protein
MEMNQCPQEKPFREQSDAGKSDDFFRDSPRSSLSTGVVRRSLAALYCHALYCEAFSHF